MHRRLATTVWLLAVILFVVAGVVLSFWWEHRRVQQLVASVKAMDGEAEVEFRGPQWLLDWAIEKKGEEYLDWLKTDVKSIRIYEAAPVDDPWMKRIQGCHDLQVLALKKAGITDAGLESLILLTDLRHLYLENTQVTDAGLTHLKKMKKLESVHLDGTRVTPAAIARLKTERPELRVYGP